METLTTQIVTVFMGFFAIMNPVANTAVFAAVTGDLSQLEKARVAVRAVLIAFVVICLFALLGKSIFHLFGISLPALRIGGGIIVFIIGYHMLSGSGSSMHSQNVSEQTDVAISPLAVPLLAGPGTIATAINYSAAADFAGIAVVVSVFFVLCVVTYLCFVSSARIIDVIGHAGMSIVTRLMGLILAVVGTQMVIDGVSAVAGIMPNLQ